MDADERQIFDFLSSYGEEWVNAKEVSRKAGGKHRFNDDNHWAWPVLQRMKDRQAIEGDQLGRYRVKPKKHKGRWVSPDIEKILEENGMAVDPEPAEPAEEDQPGQP